VDGGGIFKEFVMTVVGWCDWRMAGGIGGWGTCCCLLVLLFLCVCASLSRSAAGACCCCCCSFFHAFFMFLVCTKRGAKQPPKLLCSLSSQCCIAPGRWPMSSRRVWPALHAEPAVLACLTA
jgi:hypothetical protein